MNASHVRYAEQRQSFDRNVALGENVNILQLAASNLILNGLAKSHQKLLKSFREPSVIAFDEGPTNREAWVVIAIQVCLEPFEQRPEFSFRGRVPAQPLQQLRVTIVVLVFVGRPKVCRAKPVDFLHQGHVACRDCIEQGLVATRHEVVIAVDPVIIETLKVKLACSCGTGAAMYEAIGTGFAEDREDRQGAQLV